MTKIEEIRKDFPILAEKVYGKRFVYFDNAATTQKPTAVLTAMDKQVRRYNANIHRSPHYMGQVTTQAYEDARRRIASFFGAGDTACAVYTRGVTEAINLVAYGFLLPRLQPGDDVLVTVAEHHSNFVPFQQICAMRGAHFRVLPVQSDGTLSAQCLSDALTERTRLVAFSHVNNTFGSCNMVRTLTDIAHAKGVSVLVDGAQAAAHMKVSFDALGCDFYCISAHKVYGPAGIGVLLGKTAILEEMTPFQYGGDMINVVTAEKTTFQAPPHRFEAGTPNYSGAIGFAAALDYLDSIGGMDWIEGHEKALGAYLKEQLSTLPELYLPLPDAASSSILSLCSDKLSPLDLALLLDKKGIAVRAGSHCAQPMMASLGISGTLRVSLGLYNCYEEIDLLVQALKQILRLI